MEPTKFETVTWELGFDPQAPDRFNAFADAHGLAITEHASKQYPGSRHWHLKRIGERGVVELTWWPARERLWVSVRANRTGAWTEECVESLEANFPRP